MGQRGPARTPTAILQARGSWRAKDRSESEPQFASGVPTCPAFLSTEAKAEWRRQVKQLEAAGIVKLVDRAALAAYCEAWGEFVLVCQEINRLTGTRRDGENSGGGMGPVLLAGLVNTKNKAVERLLRLAQQFGFTPAARSRVKAEGKKEGGSDEGKARFFAG